MRNRPNPEEVYNPFRRSIMGIILFGAKELF